MFLLSPKESEQTKKTTDNEVSVAQMKDLMKQDKTGNETQLNDYLQENPNTAKHIQINARGNTHKQVLTKYEVCG